MLDRTADEPSDLAALEAVAAGDREAFTLLVTRHAASVRRLAGALTSDEATADDVTQEVFLSVWRGARGFRNEGSVRGWLLTITRNAARRSARRRVGEPAQTEELGGLAMCAGWGGVRPEPGFLRTLESRELLSAALTRLAAADREVLTLVDLEGMSLRESATMLELDVAALKSRLHRARLRLLAAAKEVSK